MKSVKVVLGLTVLAGLALSGCESTKSALGLNKVTPDEFRVVTKAPLIVPPDYALRPPAPGEPRPQELQPESAAREALLGQRQGFTRSEGEKIFASKTGADRADPLARYVIDDEFGDLTYKEKSFSDSVMFWKKPDVPVVAGSNAALGAEVAPLDAAAEKERLTKLVGEQPIIIEQKKDAKFKLPGL